MITKKDFMGNLERIATDGSYIDITTNDKWYSNWQETGFESKKEALEYWHENLKTTVADEIITDIQSQGGFNNWSNWSQSEIVQWVKLRFDCTNAVARTVARRL